MDEKRIVELLTRKIAGEASAEEQGELSYLLSRYPDSVYYEALLEQVWNLGRDNSEGAQKNAFLRHKSKFKEELKFTAPPGRLFSRPAIFALVFTVIFFAAASYVLDRYSQRLPPRRVEIKAGKGVRKQLKLTDGTQVWLNSDSKISYQPETFRGGLKEINLTGEAYFTVPGSDKSLFIVRTEMADVFVSASDLSIREYPGEHSLLTTLIRGSAELSLTSRGGQRISLKAGEQIEVRDLNPDKSDTGEQPLLQISKLLPVHSGRNLVAETAWMENKIVVRDKAFIDMVPELDRLFNIRITFDDPKLKLIRFSGIFPAENVVESLDAMKAGGKFNYRLRANQVNVY